MGNLFTDVIGPGASGIGEGVSRGIRDYGNIQAIRREEEMAPLQMGIAQATLNEAQVKQAEAKKKIKWDNAPSTIRQSTQFLEMYNDATPEEKVYIDKSIPEGVTNAGVGNYFSTLKQNTEGLNVVSSLGQRKYDKAIVDLGGQKKALEQKILGTKPTIVNNMGVVIDNPELSGYQQQLENVTKQFQGAVTAKNKFVGSTDKAIVTSMVGDLKMKYKDVFSQSPLLSMMADTAQEKGSIDGLEKFIDVIAKAKNPQITNDIEYFLSTHKGMEPTKAYAEWEKHLIKLSTAPRTTNIFNPTQAEKPSGYEDVFHRSLGYNANTKQHFYPAGSGPMAGKIVPENLVIKQGQKLEDREMSRLRAASLKVGITDPTTEGEDATPEYLRYKTK